MPECHPVDATELPRPIPWLGHAGPDGNEQEAADKRRHPDPGREQIGGHNRDTAADDRQSQDRHARHAVTLDEAARKATRYMIDHLVHRHGLDRTDAYVLASLAADLKIAEVVDVPHVLVAMHLPKAIFRSAARP